MKKLLLTVAALTLTTTAASADRYHTSGGWRHFLAHSKGEPFCVVKDDPEIGRAHIMLGYFKRKSGNKFAIILLAPDWVEQHRGRFEWYNVTFQFADTRKFDKVALFTSEDTVGIEDFDVDLLSAFLIHGTVTISLNGEQPHQVSLKGAAHAILEWYACIEKII
jgi:hypothetical protein